MMPRTIGFDAAAPGDQVDLMELLVSSSAEHVAASLVRSVGERCGGAPVAALFLDPTGKQLLVEAATLLPDWFVHLALPSAPGSGVVADVVAEVHPWNAAVATNQDQHIPGVEDRIEFVAPIALPGSSRSHGALVVFATDALDAETTVSAAHMIALAVEADLDRRHAVPRSIEAAVGLPDEDQLLGQLTRIISTPGRPGVAVLYVLTAGPGEQRQPVDTPLERVDLALVGGILQQAVRPDDLVAYVGGSDFAVAACELRSPGEIVELRDRLQDAVAGRLADADHRQDVYAADVGAAIIDGLSDASTLLDLAKRSQGAGLPIAAPGATPTARAMGGTREFTTATLTAALRDGTIRPWYQPIFELTTMEIVAVEALARWVEPDGSIISPGEFIPAITAHGLMGRLTTTMLRGVVEDTAAWFRAGIVTAGFKTSVNVSMSDVTGGLLPAVVTSLLTEHELHPSALCLELTETDAMADIDHSLATMRELHELGIGLAIDDFGTGYSSLSYLSQLPVDIVKIDRAFVQGLATRRGDEAIVRAVVDVAGAVGLTVLAEGIETEEELEHLRSLDVRLGQGFLVSAALPARDLLALLID